jgi:Flp pilus assembly protein TadD
VPTVVVAYTPALENDFVNWDDDKNFLENPYFRGFGLAQWKWAWSAFWFGVYQPLAWLLFEGEYAYWKLDPRGYHQVSLDLHAVNSVVLFVLTVMLLRRSSPDRCLERPWPCVLAAGLATALFMAHPLRVEPVVWASGQPYLPCALFSMLAVLTYLHGLREDRSPQWGWVLVSFVLFVAAVLSHAVAVTLPVVLLILDVYPLRRFGDGRGWWHGTSRRTVLLEKLPFAMVSALFIVVAVAARRQSLVVVEQSGPTASLARACYAVWFYLFKTIVPLNLNVVYPAPEKIDWIEPRFLVAIMGTVGISVGLYLARLRWPGLLVGWLCYLVILAPNSGIVRINDQIAGDRYSYLSMMGLAVVFAGVICWAWEKMDRVRAARVGLMAVGAGLVLVLIFMTREQCRTWRTSETLWAHALSHGAANSAVAHNNLGVELARQGKHEAAVAQYVDAMRLDPGYPNPRNGLGAILFERGNFELAAVQYTEALRLRPGYAAAHNNMAVLLTRQGKFDLAESHLIQALRTNPGYVSAYNNLGVALASQGKFASALAQFGEALRLNPSYSEAYNNCALIMAACPDSKYRNGAKAVEYATRACELSRWKSARFLNTFAAAHAEIGDFEQALAWQTRAMALLADQKMVSSYRSRLELYEAKRPYRETLPGGVPMDVER